MQLQFLLSDIYFNEPETRIKIKNLGTGEGTIYYLSQNKEIQACLDYFISKKDILAIGILQGIELTKTPMDIQRNIIQEILNTVQSQH
jgi:hypothetical protein